MATKIEWCEETWNPITGCTKVSSGCKNCFAERMAKRLAGRFGYPADDPFGVTYQPGRLDEPMRWRKPRRIFICSMGDLFHEKVAFPYINRVFARIAMAPYHTFLILTKRPERMRHYMTGENRIPGIADHIHWHPEWRKKHNCDVGNIRWPLRNVWLGTSVENQAAADERIPHLLNTPAAVRFVSCEPMLGPIDLCRDYDYEDYRGTHKTTYEIDRGLDWVIVGGESGPKARPMHPLWVKGIRDQCVEAGVPFLFKQWGEWQWVTYTDQHGNPMLCITPGPKEVVLHDGNNTNRVNMKRVGKKAAGREFDGREWSEYPDV